MPSLGILEIIVIGIVLILFVGPDNLPKTVRFMGRTYGRLRRAAEDLRRALVLEADRMDEEERLRELKRRREDHQERMKAQREADEASGPQAQPDEDVVVGGPASDAPHDDDEPAVAPPGFEQAEWDELPPHIKKIIQRRREADA